MADNATVTNKKTSFDADTNADIATRTTEKSLKHVQHVIIDWGGTGAESFTPPTLTTAPVPIEESSATTQALISVQDSNTSVLSANADRTAGWVKNISTQTIFVSLSGTAATNKPTKLLAGESLALGNGAWIYTGAVAAIHADAGQSHNLEVVEL